MKLIDIKDNITPKQRLVFFITLLIFIISIFYFMKNYVSNNKGIDYKNVDYNTFINESTETSDRNLYWTLNNILLAFLNSYQSVEKMDTSALIEYKYSGRSLESYYDVLDDKYKKSLSKKDFIIKSKEIMSSMCTFNDNGFSMKSEDIIKNIYKLNNYEDTYLCRLNTVDQNKKAYIGIRLDSKSGKFDIFYIQQEEN